MVANIFCSKLNLIFCIEEVITMKKYKLTKSITPSLFKFIGFLILYLYNCVQNQIDRKKQNYTVPSRHCKYSVKRIYYIISCFLYKA